MVNIAELLKVSNTYIRTIHEDNADLEAIVRHALTVSQILSYTSTTAWLKGEYAGYNSMIYSKDYRDIRTIQNFSDSPALDSGQITFKFDGSISIILEFKKKAEEDDTNKLVKWRTRDRTLVYIELQEIERLIKSIKTEVQAFLIETRKVLKEIAIHTLEDDLIVYESNYLHPEVWKIVSKLLEDGNYFYAVNELEKAYIKLIKQKSGLDQDGESLMGHAFKDTGPLKINSMRTESDRNEQEGIMFISMGISRLRNVTSHEPSADTPLAKEDALAIISIISYLWRKVDII